LSLSFDIISEFICSSQLRPCQTIAGPRACPREGDGWSSRLRRRAPRLPARASATLLIPGCKQSKAKAAGMPEPQRCTTSWTKHERAARWYVRCTLNGGVSGGGRRHVSDVPQPDIRPWAVPGSYAAPCDSATFSGAANSRKACSLRSTRPRETFRPNDFEPRFSGAIIANVSQVTP